MFFYMPMGMEQNVWLKAIYYLSVLLFLCIFRDNTPQRRVWDQTYNRWFIWLGFSFLLSVFSSFIFRSQPFGIGLMTTLPYFTYLLYFAFGYHNLTRETIHKLLISMGIISIGILGLDTITFPNIYFGTAEIDLNRGGVRVRVPGIDWIVLLFYYSLYMLLEKKGKIIWLLSVVVTFIAILASLTRQIIFISAFCGVVYYLYKSRSFFKVSLAIITIAISLRVLSNLPVIHALIDMTENQINDNRYKSDDVRVNAWSFFTVQAQKNEITPFIGNGMYSQGNSVYGNKMARTQSETYCYLTDVGWASFYFLFGYVGLIPLIILFLQSFVKFFEYKEMEPFILYLLFAAITSFTSGVILYQYQIIVVSLCFYVTSLKPVVNKK